MATPAIDYDALAKQYGAISSTPAATPTAQTPAAPAAIDYDALAKQYGAIGSTPQVTSSISYPAAAEPSPLAKTGKAFWEGVQPFLDILGGASRDPKRAQKAVDAAKALAAGIAAEPGRVWGETVRTGESMLKGDLSGTAFHAAGMVPFLGPVVQQPAWDLDRGDPASAVGHTAFLAASTFAEPLAEATGSGLATTGTVTRGALSGMMKAAPAAATAAAEKSVYGALGGPAGMLAAAKIAAAKELGKGAITGARGALAERAAAAAAQTAAEQAAREAADAALARGANVTEAHEAMVNPPRQLPPGPIVTPAPPRESFVRSVPAEYPPVELTAKEQALAAQILQNVEPLPPRLALPPGPRVITPEPPPAPPVPADTSFVRGVPAQLPEVIPPTLRTNAPAEAAATTLRDLMQQSGTAPPPETAPAPAPPPVDFATAGRAAKVDTLTSYLIQKEIPRTWIDQFGDKEWQMVAKDAGVNAPSEESITAIKTKLDDYQSAATRPADVGKMSPAEATADFAARQATRAEGRAPASFTVVPDPDLSGSWNIEAKVRGQRIGTMNLAEGPNELEVDLSHLTPKYRGQGYGKAMYQEAINLAQQLGKDHLISGSEFTEDAARVWRSLGGEQYTDAAGEQRWRLPVETPKPAVVKPQPGAAEGIHSTLDSAADAAMQRMRDRGTFTGSKLSAGIPVDDLADMAIWGASKLAKGTVDFAKWSKEILAEAGPAAARLAPELPKLYAQAQKTLDRHIANTAGDLPNTQKLLAMYRKGIEGQDWYRSTKAELQSVFGPDTNMFIDFLAATSPNTTVASNTSLALKAYMQWKAGKPFTGYLPETIKSLDKAAAGEDFGALKVRSFRKNLHGDPMPVTVDRWIARALGFGDQPTPPQYKFMDYLITQVAQKKGLEPRQVQAAIWKTIKDAEGIAGQGGESYEVLVRKKLLSDPDLAAAIKQAKGRPPITDFNRP
jgi:GNAT superfamily N-acetyltransferase